VLYLLLFAHSYDLICCSDAGATSTTFSVGTFNITYTSTPLDVGSAPVCRYNIEVLRGVTARAQAIGHASFLDVGISQDYIVEKQARVRGQVIAPVFSTADVLAEDFAYGIRGPDDDTPFSITMPVGVEGKVVVNLLWCQPGEAFVAADLSSVAATIILSGNEGQLTFTDKGSGMRAAFVLLVSAEL